VLAVYSANGPRHEIIEKVKEILLAHPLGDRCLGRLFASYGLGLSNALRGRALKTALAMQIHKEIMEGKTEKIEHLRKIAENGGKIFDELARRYVGYVTHKECEVCNGRLEKLIGELTLKAYNELCRFEGKSFLVGVKKGSQIALREKSIAELYGLTSWESVGREVKREVGKRLQSLTGMNPDFKYCLLYTSPSPRD
jgi:tRNA pseudouridine synthase 10